MSGHCGRCFSGADRACLAIRCGSEGKIDPPLRRRGGQQVQAELQGTAITYYRAGGLGMDGSGGTAAASLAPAGMPAMQRPATWDSDDPASGLTSGSQPSSFRLLSPSCSVFTGNLVGTASLCSRTVTSGKTTPLDTMVTLAIGSVRNSTRPSRSR